MFKWVCLLVAVVALTAFGWILNDIRLDVKNMSEKVETRLPRILTQTEQVTSQLDQHLPKLLAETEKAASTVNKHLPKLLADGEQAANNLAELSDGLQQYQGLMGVVHANAQNKNLLAYSTDVLKLVEGQKAVIGTKNTLASPGQKQAQPARAWAGAAQKQAQFLSTVASNKAQMLQGLTRSQSANPWLIQLENEAPRPLVDWIRKVHAESSNLE